MTMAANADDLADRLEYQQLEAFADVLATKSLLYHLGDGNPIRNIGFGQGTGKRLLMGEDPRLPAMPEKPTLQDFFRCRFAAAQTQHLLQSARLARRNGLPEKMVLACLLHDISVAGFIRSDHGYWGAQLIAPYVDEEVAWAIRMHQSLRFFPDEAAGYPYPEIYVTMFGADFRPDPYIVADYERARKHRWYMSARIICVNDLYSFDPDVTVELEEFDDVIGRHFRQPEEGLGNDDSPTAHMWRTLRRPASAL